MKRLFNMPKEEIYFRIKRMLIIILISMVIISFIAIINLNAKLEDNIQATNILMEYITR